MNVALINRKRQFGVDARTPCWPRSAVRIGFGLIWLVDAVFKWLPDFHKGIVGMVQGAATGQPSWLHGWFHFWINAVQANPTFWAYGIAALETLIALAIILGSARKITYMVTIVAAIFIWGIAEGFGGPYTGTSTDIGAAVMYAVVALALLALSFQLGPDRYSIDYWLEQRVSWWHKVAEIGAHNHPAPGENGSVPLAVPEIPLANPTAAPAGGGNEMAPAPPAHAHVRSPSKTVPIASSRSTLEARTNLRWAKLREVETELVRRRHLPVSDQRRWLGSVLRGHYTYYTVLTPGARKSAGPPAAVAENGSAATIGRDDGSVPLASAEDPMSSH